MMVQTQQEQGEGSAIPTDPQHTPIITQPSSLQPQKKQKPRKPSRKNRLEVPQASGYPPPPPPPPSTTVAVETGLITERDDSLVRAATTASILEAEQDVGGVPRRLDTIGDTSCSNRFGRVYSKIFQWIHCSQNGDEVVVESEVANKDVNLSVNEVPLAQALAALKSAKVQEKGDVIKEPSVPVSAASTKVSTATITIAATTIIAASTRPRAKGIVFHEEEQATTPIVSSQQPS
ncbi:hypothetical protein Tco_0775159 [Tanacetum coccineum]